jgi:hypothetical protein
MKTLIHMLLIAAVLVVLALAASLRDLFHTICVATATATGRRTAAWT